MRSVLNLTPLVCGVVLALLAVGAADVRAQAPAAEPGPIARNPTRSLPNIVPGTLRDVAKFRYIYSQLDLTAEQTEAAEALIATYEAGHKQVMDNMQANLDRIRDLSNELTVATQANDEAEIRRIHAELGQFGNTSEIEAEFYANLESTLTPEQKTLLEEVRDMLSRNPTGQFRPVDVLQIARSLDLSAEQRKQVGAVETAFRREINSGSPPDPAKREQLLQKLIAEVRGALNEAQVGKFDARVNRMRNAAGARSAPQPPRAHP